MQNTSLYDECLALAFRIREIEPWEDIDDSDTYAIQMQDGSYMYIVTMGNGGLSYDVLMYDGAESFSYYIRSVKGDTLPYFERVDDIYWSDYMSVMFLDPADGLMSPEQYRQVKQWALVHKQNVYPAHGHPFLYKYRPHRRPCIPSDETLTRMKEALEAVEWFSQEISDSFSLSDLGFKEYREYPTAKGGKVIPLVVKTKEGYKVERTKLPGLSRNYPTVVLPETELKPLRYMQRSGTQYCRLVHLPGCIRKGPHDENVYCTLAFFSVDKATDMVSVTEFCELSDTPEQEVLRQFIKKIKGDGRLPQRIITDNPRTEALLREFCRDLGIILELKRTRIPTLTDACQALYDNF